MRRTQVDAEDAHDAIVCITFVEDAFDAFPGIIQMHKPYNAQTVLETNIKKVVLTTQDF